jgi:FtsP/CotA-like multicopper oxidase with cupredoxin domain
MSVSRRNFLKMTGVLTGSTLFPTIAAQTDSSGQTSSTTQAESTAEYTIKIGASPIEIAPKRIISTTTYNGHFPGPLLRLKEGQQVTVNIYNDTDTPEQLHWHGQMVPVDVDGAAEEGTPFIPAHGKRRIVFTPTPAGLRFYHTHNRAGANLAAGQYSGEVGPLYIEPKHEPGNYDREVFLTLKEFEPTFSRGGDMAMDFLSPATRVKALEEQGESAMKASRQRHAKRIRGRLWLIYHQWPDAGARPTGSCEAGRTSSVPCVKRKCNRDPQSGFARPFLQGSCIRRKPSAESHERSVLWLGTAERVSAIVEMSHPGIWIMGDLADDDRRHGMGIVVEYGGRVGKPQWIAPPPFRWNYARFAKPGSSAPPPDETFEMTFVKDNAAEEGFNRWTINGIAYPMASEMAPASFHLNQGKRYRIHMRNASDDIHPIHLHRHSFELTNLAGTQTAGIMKDVVMLGGYQEVAVDFVANNPGLTLFHCHQQLHMDFGFMTLFDYV